MCRPYELIPRRVAVRHAGSDIATGQSHRPAGAGAASYVIPREPAMNHADHVQLIEKGIDREGGIWVDFGAGSGAFTLALRDIAGSDIELIAIDRDRSSLQTLGAIMERL